MQVIRQGDVWLYPIEKESERNALPAFGGVGHKRNWRTLRLDPKDPDVLLALGEVTGHAHRIKRSPNVKFRQKVTLSGREILNGRNQRRILQVRDEPVELTHEEHKTLTIPPGDYEVRIQREYAPEVVRQERTVYD